MEDDELPSLEPQQISVRIGADANLEGEFDPDLGLIKIVYRSNESFSLPRRILEKIVNDMLHDVVFGKVAPSPFVVTSERTGVALFYKDLDYNSNAIISHLRDSEKIDPIKIIESMRSRYARPIQDNIDTVRDYDNASKRKSFLRASKDKYKPVFDALSELLGGGSFKAVNGQLSYAPRKKRNQPKILVPLYIASSSVKSIFLIDMYINFMAKPGQILIIDEPELNLHPDNQVKLARLLVRLVNSGVKVLMTTHSDYIVREINNLISMSAVGEERERLISDYSLSDADILSVSQVKAYCANPSTGFSEVEISNTGIDTAIFDHIISHENQKAQDINYSVEG